MIGDDITRHYGHGGAPIQLTVPTGALAFVRTVGRPLRTLPPAPTDGDSSSGTKTSTSTTAAHVRLPRA